MSYDLAAGSRNCDHLCILERYQIDAFDFRTLHYAANPSINMRAPINGAAMLRLYFKGTLVKPTDPNFGYSLMPDPARVQEEGVPFQKILFNNPVRMLTPLIEVTYFTRQPQCLKCGGTGKVVDWAVSQSGGLMKVTQQRKLAQQAIKFLTATKNPFNPNLVCPIRSYVGRKFGLNVTDQDIATAVTQAMVTYQGIQRAQKTVQTMDPTEMIQSVDSVTAKQDPSDPTKVYVSIVLSCYGSTQAIPLNISLQAS
jgi:hypothetical protein